MLVDRLGHRVLLLAASAWMFVTQVIVAITLVSYYSFPVTHEAAFRALMSHVPPPFPHFGLSDVHLEGRRHVQRWVLLLTPFRV